MILAYFGAEWIVMLLVPTTRALFLGLCFLAVIAVEYRIPPTTSRAMNAASSKIFAAADGNLFILVGSTTAGEGAITAEVATRDRSRQWYVVCGFNVLGSGDFMGTDYRPRFASPSDLAQWIEREGIGWVVIDTSPSSLSWTHNVQLWQIAQSGREGWSLAGWFPNSHGKTLVYEISVPAGTSVDHTELLSIAPTRMIGR